MHPFSQPFNAQLRFSTSLTAGNFIINNHDVNDKQN